MQRSPIHLLGGGPGSDVLHVTGLLRKALDSCSSTRPSVAYIGAANGDHTGFFKRVTELLQAAGAGKVTLTSTCGRHAAPEKTACRALESCDVVFMSGGDVEAGMHVLNATNLITPLKASFDAGAVFIGLSAGSVMLGREWIAWRDPNNDATAQLFPCLGFVPFSCDAHGEEDSWSELRSLVQRTPVGSRVYGIGTDAMLSVHPDGRLETTGGAVLCLERTPPGVREIQA